MFVQQLRSFVIFSKLSYYSSFLSFGCSHRDNIIHVKVTLIGFASPKSPVVISWTKLFSVQGDNDPTERLDSQRVYHKVGLISTIIYHVILQFAINIEQIWNQIFTLPWRPCNYCERLFHFVTELLLPSKTLYHKLSQS